MLLYTDERMLNHKPKEGHPERPDRLATVLRHLRRTGQLDRAERPLLRPATNEELSSVHDPAYIHWLGEQLPSGPHQIEADTWISPGSQLAARLAAGAVVDAITAVLNTSTRQAACLVRPPGHHARPAHPMGFCLFNSVAIGVATAIARSAVNRVLIVDWDVHHGNGTQEIFEDRADVGFVSIHRAPFYPGSGSKSETGTGAGLGFTRNVPLAMGVTQTEYHAAFRSAVESMADIVNPELIVLSAGFDAHREDPVGSLGLENEDFVALYQIVAEIARTKAQGRVVSVLEGGYNCSILAGCVADHLAAIEKTE